MRRIEGSAVGSIWQWLKVFLVRFGSLVGRMWSSFRLTRHSFNSDRGDLFCLRAVSLLCFPRLEGRDSKLACYLKMLRPYTKKAFWFCEGRFFLPVVGTLYSIGLALFLFVVVTDPYNLRADNAKVSLTDHHGYSEDVTGRLASIVAKGDYDLVVVGGSATMGFTTEMLRAAFPESRRAFNLSFVGITPEEERIILRLLLNSKALKRLVLSVDVTLAQQASKPYGYFPMYHYQHPWHVLAPEFSFETLLLSFRVATTGVLDSPQWWRGELPNRFVYAQPLPSREGEMQKLQKAVDAMRAAPKSHKEVACESVYWLERMVMPLVRDFWSRDVNVDLVFPPYFLAVYADWEFRNKMSMNNSEKLVKAKKNTE